MYFCPKCEIYIEDDELENTDFNCPYCKSTRVVRAEDIEKFISLEEERFIAYFEKGYGEKYNGSKPEHAYIKEKYYERRNA
jgi:Zn-finger nucleic acid-binding protein